MSSCSKNVQTIQLQLLKALPIHGFQGVETSGLCLYNEELFTISDNHDSIIFKIELKDSVALLSKEKIFHMPVPENVGKLDFEGITCDDEGNFYLISERMFDILKVDSQPHWIAPDLLKIGKSANLFQTYNAFLEGIAWLGDNKFILCAERQPRGIILYDSNDSSRIQAMQSDYSILSAEKHRALDFSGLFAENESIFILERFANSIARIEITENQIEEKEFWSFKHIEDDPEYQYLDTQFGHAEGLAMDKNYVYIVVDNNGDSRQKDLADNRPLLFIFHRPD